VKIKPTDMPSILEALRPGIQGDDFYVHHVGLDLLPARTEDLPNPNAKPELKRLGQAFGFIKYGGDENKPVKPVPDPVPAEPGDKYHFVVKTFKVGFSNSRVDYFDCKVVVGANRFFRDAVALPGAETTRKITLLGTYGKEGPEGNEVTVFSLRTDPKEDKKWNFTDSFIKLVELGSASFVVTGETVIEVAGPGGQPEKKKVPARAELLFDGKIEFNSDKQAWKSLFEVESVTFEKIGFGFTYTHGNAPGLGLGFVAGKSSWKIEPKLTAINSFLSMFAIKWTGFRFGTGGSLKLPDLGFAPIKWPETDLGEIFDFAFELEIDLGGLGKLAGDFKSIKLPCLLGWLRGGKGVSLGLQWPTLNGKLSLGIQQFIQLQADELQFGPCDAGVVLTLKKLRLVLLGEPLPKDDTLDAFAFVSTRHHGKTSWAFKYDKTGGDEGAWFSVEKLGFAHRVQVSTKGRSSVKEIVEQYELPRKPASPCEVLENWKPIDNDNWLVLGKFRIAQLLQAWFIVDDNGAKPTYGLYVDLIDNIGVGLLYEKISDELGKFAGEIDLRKTFPPMNFGAATLTLPVIGLEYYTDGGFQIDIGFPWNNDFSRSARLSFGIYTGAGGLYYGRVNAAALEESILKVDRLGYQALPKGRPDSPEEKLRQEYAHTVLLAGFALEVGYGKELELGILSARVAITVFGVLEGAMGWRKKPKGDVQIWYYKGKVGVNIHIEGSVNFLIIRARAVIRASIAVGLTKKRILAQRTGGEREIGYLTCPTTLFIEAQLTVYAEATLSIGCVEITFHFEFHATYTDEFELDSESFDVAGRPAPAALPDMVVGPWLKSFGGPQLAEKKALQFLVGAVATLAHPADFPGEQTEEGWVNCVVVQPLISTTDFESLGEVLAAWYFQTVTKRVFGAGTTNLTEVRQVVKALQNDPLWSAAEVWPELRDLLDARFEMTFTELKDGNPAIKDHLAVPPWPEVEWRLRTLQADGKPRAEVLPGLASTSKMTAAYAQSVNELFQGQTRRGLAIPQGAPSAAAVQFVDYIKSLLSGLFSRMETTLIRDGEALKTGDPGVRQLADAKVFALMKAGETTSLAKLGAELNRSLLAGGRLPDPEDAKRYLPFTRLTGQQFVVPPNLPEKPEDHEKMRTEIFGLRNGAEVVKVTRGSATLAEFFRAARVSRKALETALIPLATPTWTLHATELTIREAGDLRGTWPIHRFEGAFLHEIQKPNAGRNVSVVRYTRKPAEPIKKPVQTVLPSTQWRPCLTAEFAARISVEGGQIELMGAPEVERLLLDRLVQEMKHDGHGFKLFGALREDLPANTDGEATPTKLLSFVPATSLVRTNLSRRARPLDQPQIRPLGEGEEKPYQATWKEQKQFIELLQIAAITNRGGYFLSSVGELPAVTDESKNKYVLTFILVQEKESEGELKAGFPWPAWANGISIEKPGDETMEHWHTMQFHGDRHWQLQPAAPAGAVAWAWRYQRAGNRPVSVLGEQINRLVARQFARREDPAPATDRLVTDTRRLKSLRQAIRELATPVRNPKGGATLAELSEEEKNLRAFLLASDGFSNAAQMLDFEMDGVRRDDPRVLVRLFEGDKTIPAPPDSREWAEQEQKTASDQPTPENEPVWIGSIPTAVVEADAGAPNRLQAEEEKPWNHRAMQEVPLRPGGGSPESPYAMLAAFSAIQITAGFRDVYGNRLTQRLSPLRLPLFYTDALLSPGQWPHFSFIVLAESTAKKLIFRVEFAGLEAKFEETPAERAARLKRVLEKEAPREAAFLDAVIKQLHGANGKDVNAELLLEAKDQAEQTLFTHPTPLLEKLLPLLEAVLSDYQKFLPTEPGQPPGPLPGKREQEWTLILPARKLAACAHLTASMKISRTDFGPPPDYLAALGVAEGGGITQTEIPVRFFHGTALAKPDAATPIERIAGNLQACLPAAWEGRVAYRQASRSDHEFWVIPRSAFPATPSNCFYWTARPWQTKLGSGSFPIPVLQDVPPGGGETFESYAGAPTRNLSNLDADVVGRAAFSFLARISREPAAVDSPKLRELLEHMDDLAQVLSATEGNHPFVVPLFARKPEEKEPGKPARENMHDVLVDAVRSDLRAFYQVDTLIQYDLKIAAPDQSVVAFHGSVVPKWDRTSPLPHPSFSDFRILNRPAPESGPTITHLGFSYDLPPGANYQKQVLESLAFEISHVQLVAPGSQREEFAVGPWLKLLPEDAVPLPDIATIPAITREYPAKPEITQPVLSVAAVPEAGFKIRDLLAVKPEFTVGVRHMRDGTEPDANDFLDVVVQFNPEIPAPGPRPLAAWTWISDLHVLLVLEELSAYFYGLPENQRGAQLRRILALAADACGQLVSELGRAVRAAALQAQNQDKLPRFNFNEPPANLAYAVGKGVAGEGITRKTLQRREPLHLTSAGAERSAVWAVQPAVVLVRNSEIFQRPVNGLLTYTTERITTAEPIWAEVSPRLGGVSGWKIPTGADPDLTVRLAGFFEEFLGDPKATLDYDLDLILAHVFPLNASKTLFTKNIRHPIFFEQGKEFDGQATARAIVEVLTPIKKPVGAGHFLELDIALRRNTLVAEAKERRIIFRERFWFAW